MILYYKRMVENNKMVLDDFTSEYILKNYDYPVREVNRVIYISSDFGEILQKKHELEFTPKKLFITRVIGEMKGSYHCYAQYRQSVPAKLMYINKKYILTPFDVVDYKAMEVYFDKYDRKTPGMRLKEHQKFAVKFMLGNKRCILADSMGLGKTISSIVAALESGSEKILVITTASLKTNWKREISFYENPDKVKIVSGKKWEVGERFTILNYDIIDNFHEIAYEDEYEQQAITGKGGKIEYVKVPVMVKDKKGNLVNKKVKSMRKDKINEALANSELFKSHFDCVIIDEAQKLSNNTSVRYKVISDFLSKSKPEFVFLLTGTPLTNDPMNLYRILKLINADVTTDYEYYVTRYCGGKKMYKKGEWGRWFSIYQKTNNIGSWNSLSKEERAEAMKYIDANAASFLTSTEATNLNELREKIKHVYIRRLLSDISGMVNKNVETLYYDLTDKQRSVYDRLWDEYIEAQSQEGDETNEQYRQLVEGMLIRQYLANEMIDNTKNIVDEKLQDGEKVIIVCTFQDEIAKFKEYYGDKAVVYDGKMNAKKKDEAQDKFMNDPNINVFIAQYLAAGVGLTLTVSKFMIFNSFSWVAADNFQMEDRIYRLTQKEDVCCVYQVYNDSVLQDMYEKVLEKERIMKDLIKSENEK